MSRRLEGRTRRRLLLLLLSVALLGTACGSDGDDGTSPSASSAEPQVVAVVASVDLWAGDPQRVSVGLVTNDNRLVSYGTADFAFSYLGTEQEPIEPQPGPTTTGAFVPTYGTDGDGRDAPTITLPSEARGVYQATDVTFDRAGFWQVSVTMDVAETGPLTALATFPVGEEAALPAPGDPALATENLTVDSKGVPAAAIDSRAADGDSVPDPELHRSTIAEALDEGNPALVVFATPVYCVSQFCGPMTDMVQDIADRSDRSVRFIHVEIWKDFEKQELNEAATDWLRLPSGEVTEPWLYLIGADGVIVDRWSSLWSEDEVAAELDALPAAR